MGCRGRDDGRVARRPNGVEQVHGVQGRTPRMAERPHSRVRAGERGEPNANVPNVPEAALDVLTDPGVGPGRVRPRSSCWAADRAQRQSLLRGARATTGRRERASATSPTAPRRACRREGGRTCRATARRRSDRTVAGSRSRPPEPRASLPDSRCAVRSFAESTPVTRWSMNSALPPEPEPISTTPRSKWLAVGHEPEHLFVAERRVERVGGDVSGGREPKQRATARRVGADDERLDRARRATASSTPAPWEVAMA